MTHDAASELLLTIPSPPERPGATLRFRVQRGDGVFSFRIVGGTWGARTEAEALAAEAFPGADPSDIRAGAEIGPVRSAFLVGLYSEELRAQAVKLADLAERLLAEVEAPR